MKHVQSIIAIVIVAVFTDVVIFCCRFHRLPFLPVAVFTVYRSSSSRDEDKASQAFMSAVTTSASEV